MLNKKEYLLLELYKMYQGVLPVSELDVTAEEIIAKGEAYQLELEEAERLRDDDNETFDLGSDEL